MYQFRSTVTLEQVLTKENKEGKLLNLVLRLVKVEDFTYFLCISQLEQPMRWTVTDHKLHNMLHKAQ